MILSPRNTQNILKKGSVGSVYSVYSVVKMNCE